jgi:hypothetical protein
MGFLIHLPYIAFKHISDQLYKNLGPKGLMTAQQRDDLRSWVRNEGNFKDELRQTPST